MGTTSYNIIQLHTTSYDIIQCHTTSYNIIQHHRTSYDVIRRHTTSYNIILHHSISPLCGIFKSKLGTFGQPPSLCEMFLNYRLLFYFKSFPNIHCTIQMGGGWVPQGWQMPNFG